MARSGKGAGNPLLPIAIIAVVVAAVIAAVFTTMNESPPSEATIIPEDGVEAEPAGAGTAPEGEADETEEGITDVVDEVTPAAPGEEQVPAADEVEAETPDGGTEGETDADEQVTGTANSPVTDSGEAASGGASGSNQGGNGSEDDASTAGAIEAGEAGTGGADGQLGNEGSPAPQQGEEDSSATDEFLMDEDSDASTTTSPETTVPSQGGEGLPQGRDAETDLDPEEGQEVIRDTDEGGAGFVPTPSGPEGRDDETILNE